MELGPEMRRDIFGTSTIRENCCSTMHSKPDKKLSPQGRTSYRVSGMGATINIQRYQATLQNLRRAIKSKRSGLLSYGSVSETVGCAP
ncbi:hypothetical protein TNCV_2496731 [Trichonephila clavipes]|nr:hypothetical protein TNCV_2496731 [Trichonephila clavipes]